MEEETMKYVIADIHGCYEEFMELLEKISFSEQDELFVLGDVLDRGTEPIKTMQEIMGRKNIKFILGNHEYMFALMLQLLDNEDIAFEEKNTLLSDWFQDGAIVTSAQFLELKNEAQDEILDYIKNSVSYYKIEMGEKNYILVHAGIEGFEEGKELEKYEIADFVSGRIDYEKRLYFDENTYIITGHTPTPAIRKDKQPLIYEGNGHIAIDCACVFGGRLAAYCLDTEEVTYVDAKQREIEEELDF